MSLILERRGLLAGLFVARAIVRAASIMPVKVQRPIIERDWNKFINDYMSQWRDEMAKAEEDVMIYGSGGLKVYDTPFAIGVKSTGPIYRLEACVDPFPSSSAIWRPIVTLSPIRTS